MLGGFGLSAGYLAAAGSAALLEPHFGWRIMWFLGLPTGVILIVLNRFIPESPKFLLLQGRTDEAVAIMKRFKTHLPVQQWSCALAVDDSGAANTSVLFKAPFSRITPSLNLAALAWGFVNFGLLLWLPAELRARGFNVAGSDVLLTQSSLIALPTGALTAWLYAKWSTKWTLVLFALLTAVGLCGISLLGVGLPLIGNAPLPLIALLMVGANGIIAVLLPYSAETYPLPVRGRGTGFVAGSSKLGGMAGQIVTLAAFVPGLSIAAMILTIPIVASAALIGRYGAETRERSLEEIDCRSPAEAKAG
jgi:putative MFS transporter